MSSVISRQQRLSVHVFTSPAYCLNATTNSSAQNLSEPVDNQVPPRNNIVQTQFDDILEDMNNNVEDGKTLLNQFTAIDTTAAMPPTGVLSFLLAF